MSDSVSFSVVALPQELGASDVLAFRDQTAARIALVVPVVPEEDEKGTKKKNPKKNKEPDEPPKVKLPEGLEPLEALPTQIGLAWKRFDAAVQKLQAFRAERASALADEAHKASDETEKDLANAYSDDRWRAFERWNSGAVGLDDDGKGPSPVAARWLYAQLFPAPDGLRFITHGTRAQWAGMVPRMSTLASEKAQAILADFGGVRHYQQLLAAHERYAAAFGYSTVVLEPVGGPTDGRPQWTTARDTLRALVQKIESYADPELEGSEALARFLLKPFVDMVQDFQKGRPRKKVEPEGATPAAEPATPEKPEKG